MQTILGSGGAIGIPLARELSKYTDRIRLVSRNPEMVNPKDELFPLDVTNYSRIAEAIAGSEVVYIAIGFKYSLKVWQAQWPSFMKSVIEACKENGAKLVFFDNVYLYDKSAIPFMTEDSPVNPPSEKGQVRKIVYNMIMDEIGRGNLECLVARSADFYGPVIRSSMLGEMVISNLLKGKRVQVFGNPDKIHTYTYTPDAGKAVALLGNSPDAYNQVWHLPTTKELFTNRQWINLIAAEMGKEPQITVIPNWILKILGLFVPILKEFPEMLYQYESDYIFDSSKFENRFAVKATTPAEGVRETIRLLQKHTSGYQDKNLNHEN
jgi:nucleoside-diphosphate-sugar epimerase